MSGDGVGCCGPESCDEVVARSGVEHLDGIDVARLALGFLQDVVREDLVHFFDSFFETASVWVRNQAEAVTKMHNNKHGAQSWTSLGVRQSEVSKTCANALHCN